MSYVSPVLIECRSSNRAQHQQQQQRSQRLRVSSGCGERSAESTCCCLVHLAADCRTASCVTTAAAWPAAAPAGCGVVGGASAAVAPAPELPTPTARPAGSTSWGAGIRRPDACGNVSRLVHQLLVGQQPRQAIAAA